MKFIHLADLHLGKSVNGFSMINDQKKILDQIIQITGDERPDAVLIAGDIYDRPVPTEESVRLMNSFITELAGMTENIFMIYGNHDSAGRLSFASGLLSKNRVYISPVFDGKLSQTVLQDAYGDVCVTMLPFIKPSAIYRTYSGGETADTADAVIREGNYDEAFRLLKSHMCINKDIRNIIISHQFVAGGSRCDSEEVSVGGLDSIGTDFFSDFEYAALGHLHGPQKSGRDCVRYAGSPLKYSFSEENQRKSVPVVELKEKGNIEIRLLPLRPERDMRTVKGSFADICAAQTGTGPVSYDYVRAVLTDEADVPDAVGRLRHVYPNIMCIEYDNSRTRNLPSMAQLMTEKIERKAPEDYISELFRMQNGHEMDKEQSKIVDRLLRQITDGRDDM